MKLKDRDAFKKIWDKSVKPEHLLSEGSNVSEELRHLVALPDSEIQLDWVDDAKHIRFMERFLRERRVGRSRKLEFLSRDKADGPVWVVVSIAELNDEAIRSLLQKHPEARALAFYAQLLDDKAIKQLEDRRLLIDRLNGLRLRAIEERE
jgi:hypothetical protein